MKWVWRIAGIGLVALAGWWGWQRFFVSDETRIKQAITALTAAVEKNNLLALADGVAGDYGDEHGLDKSALLGAVRAVRSQYDAMFIHISDAVVQVADDRQTGQATVVAKILTSRAAGNGTEINAERVRLFFRRTDDGWKLIRVESPELKFD